MPYYPISIDLADKQCLVVGGGNIAFRKTLGLLRAGAQVSVVAERFSRGFSRLGRRVRRIRRPFRPQDITAALALVIGATDSLEVNKAVAIRCAQMRILCNIVDNPVLCSFIVPAVLRRGPLTISVSTGGASPFLSREVRKRIAAGIGPEYTALAVILAGVRKKLRDIVPDPALRNRFWHSFFGVDPAALVRRHGAAYVKAKAFKLLDVTTQDKAAR
jgi:siroheme synthase-like protein